ncbi:MAG TPA: hypothetical protein VJZ71_20130 [Phycisphaerae bacterium]|nr:hypothetical protein [Phycisphaerae bacterium]
MLWIAYIFTDYQLRSLYRPYRDGRPSVIDSALAELFREVLLVARQRGRNAQRVEAYGGAAIAGLWMSLGRFHGTEEVFPRWAKRVMRNKLIDYYWDERGPQQTITDLGPESRVSVKQAPAKRQPDILLIKEGLECRCQLLGRIKSWLAQLDERVHKLFRCRYQAQHTFAECALAIHVAKPRAWFLHEREIGRLLEVLADAFPSIGLTRDRLIDLLWAESLWAVDESNLAA